MYELDGHFGMDQIYPIMGSNHELYDYNENYENNNKNNDNENDDDKYILDNETSPKEVKKEKFIPIANSPIHHQPNSYNYIKSMMYDFYNRSSTNFIYLFIIFILSIMYILQRQNNEQLKLLITLMNNNNLILKKYEG